MNSGQLHHPNIFYFNSETKERKSRWFRQIFQMYLALTSIQAGVQY